MKLQNLTMKARTCSSATGLLVALAFCLALGTVSCSKPYEPQENSLFAPPLNAEAAKHDFDGAISIPSHPLNSTPSPILPAEIAGKKTQLFPSIQLQFVSYNGHLVPADRGILQGEGDSFWQISVEPGRVWSQAGEARSFAAFPFVLTSNIENETYHGLAQFRFDDSGPRQLRYQLVHQLTPFLVKTWFTASNEVAVEFQPAIAGSPELISNFEKELQHRLPMHSWSALENKVGAQVLADFDTGIEAEKTVISGLVLDDEIYLHSTFTPWGDYPYPEGMRLGIWSASKTVAGLTALMRMAQKYGDEVLDYRIIDYVDLDSDHDGWENVRFRDALNMATGIGVGSTPAEPNDISGDYIASDVEEYMAWYLAPGLDEKLEWIAASPNYPWGPGEVARYRDRDTFVLAAALDSLLRQREGPQANLWDMLREEVYSPIGIHHIQSTGTNDADRSMVPFLGWGIYATVDDLARISRLFQDMGRHNGTQLLSRKGLEEAFYVNGINGLPTGSSNRYGDKTYHLSFWHEAFVSDSGQEYTAPKMVGWGGVVIQLMPNGMIGFRIGNGGQPEVENMMLIADQIRPFDDYGRDGKQR